MKRIYVLFILIIPFVFGCGNGAELEKLQAENDSLRSVSTEGGIKIDEYFKAFNEIQENLNEIKRKEKIISTNTSVDGELDQNAKDQINEDILSIYELMLKNKQTIQRLNRKLKSTGRKNSELEKTIRLLTEQIELKDKEINHLKDQLAQMNIDMVQLNEEVEKLTSNIDTLEHIKEEQTEVIEEQDTKLNTAYYVYGTKSELKDHKVITKEGLFKGIKIGENFDKDYFTQIDIREVTSIKLNVNNVRIMSNHASTSYELVEKDGKIESLEIKDPHKFWEMSKYLVMIIR